MWLLKIKKTQVLLFCILVSGYCQAATFSHKLIHAKIFGLSPQLSKKIQTRLEKNQVAIQKDEPTLIQHWYQRCSVLIRKALASFGYFHPKIQGQLLLAKREAIFNVMPGQRVMFKQVQIQILGVDQSDPRLQKLLAHLPIKSGQGFSMSAYNDTKQQLFTYAQAQGYLDAFFTQHQVVIDLKNNTAVVSLQLTLGSRYYFGPVTWKQNTFDVRFLQRYLTFKIGDPYSPQVLIGLQNDLNNSNYFQSVNLESQTREQQTIPIHISLLLKPSQQYTAGLGYSTDVGPRLSLGWQSRYLNKWGHTLSVFSQLSEIQDNLAVTYNIPGLQPAQDQYYINLALSKQKLPQVTTLTQQIGVAWSKRFDNKQQTLFLNYQRERFVDSQQITERTYLLVPGVSWTYNQFDTPLFPQHGYGLSVKVQGASESILSTTSFLQTEFKSKYITTFANEQRRIVLFSDLGYTWIQNVHVLPPSLFFYAGGSQSVRGYDYQSLGPGRYLFIASAEYQQRIRSTLYATVFFDTGNAVLTLPLSLKSSVGVGGIWVSPLGPITLSVAKALDLPGQPWRVQFALSAQLL